MKKLIPFTALIILVFIIPLLFQCGGEPKTENVGFRSSTGFAEVNGSRIYYEVAGVGISIFLIHGWSFDTRCWQDQVPILAKDYKVICYDLRGFGKSSLPDSIPYSHTEDLIALMDFLNIEKAIFLGHSFGGRIAIDMALKYPGRTIGLILPEGAMDADDFVYSQELVTWISSTWKTGREEGIEKAKDIWINASPLLPALNNEHAAPLVNQMINDYSGWHWNHDDPVVFSEPYSVKKLNEIRTPTLILYGKESPSDYFKVAQIQHDNITGSKLVAIDSAGHALNIENSEQFNSEVLYFLKEIF
jgi:3-oxoadipate enol-lactonase